ncbi:hypothetical protein FRB96_009014 [Tulasnella sp. 330]|nr:hypothetical protein FRB96_009014 [Tulasnella sp. 330]
MASASAVRAVVIPNLQNVARSSVPSISSIGRQQAATTSSLTRPEPSSNGPTETQSRQRGRGPPRRSKPMNSSSAKVPRTVNAIMRAILKYDRPDRALKFFRRLEDSAQHSIRQDTISMLLTKLVRGYTSTGRETQTQAVSMPAYPWLRPNPDAPLVVPATPRPLRDAAGVLETLRNIGYPRNASMYEPIIEGHLKFGNLPAAVNIYAELVVDWSMARAHEMPEGVEKEERMVSIARCKDMIAARREVGSATAGEEAKRGLQVPLPSVELLQAILTKIEAHLTELPRIRRLDQTRTISETKQPLTTDRRPKGIVPEDSPNVFWALESCRILSALVLHKVLPFHGYQDFAPLLHILRMIPEAPRYTIEVVLPKSQDYNPQMAPQWLQPRPIPYGWASVTSVPHTFRPSLYLFARTLLRVMSGASRVEAMPFQPLPILGLPMTKESHPTVQIAAGQ